MLLLLFTLFANVTFNSLTIIPDNLIPYPNGGHTDKKRTHRYVRSCLHINNGHLTNEFIKLINTSETVDLSYFHYETDKFQYGHRAIVKDPLNMISVLEPMQAGSCSKKLRSFVSESSKQKNCVVATNAGFFGVTQKDEGACLGNIISDGNYVQDSDGVQNANFGIRQDGTVVIGYLSEEEVLNKTNPFVQLISGVGWVIRNGELYLNQSEKAECRELETTGSLHTFFSVKSARTLIGYDKFGYVHLVQFDGKTNERGVNLYEAASYLQSVGIVNAINFDGGGSATFTVDSTVINYPSNECNKDKDKLSLCEKKVSTILCIYQKSKQRNNQIGSLETWKFSSNRNYVMVIVCTVIIGLLLLSNVFLCNAYLIYREKVKFISRGGEQQEALRSLLEENNQSSGPESDEDEL